MRTTVGAVVLCAAFICGDQLFAGTASDCSFRIAAQTLSPAIVGEQEVTGRARIMAQPDSPVAIVRLDLTHMGLTVGGGTFEARGRYVVDVINISDRALTDVLVNVWVGFARASGTGSGFRLGRTLQPGAKARIEWSSGVSRGTSDRSDDIVSIVGLAAEVKTAGCTYKPSQSWPSAAISEKQVAID